MSETIEPVVETGVPAGVAAPAPEGAETGLEQEPLAPVPEPPKHEPWYHQRIKQQTARLSAETARAEAAERRLQVLEAAHETWQKQQGQAPAQTTTPAPVTPQQVDVEARAAQIADERATATSFNARCNEVFEAGKAAHTDFAQKIGAFEHLGGLGQHVDFVKDVIDLPNGAQVLYALANDLDQAAHVLSLPARKQAMVLAALSSSLAAAPAAEAPLAPVVPPAPALSKAPPPTRPIAGRANSGPGDIYDPKLSMGDFIKLRQKK